VLQTQSLILTASSVTVLASTIDNLFCRGIFKEYGGKGIYKDQSACGSNASKPPVIVDENGNYYGRFSLGRIYGHNDSVCAGVLYGDFRHQGTCEIV
jgi:hypothetical protein